MLTVIYFKVRIMIKLTEKEFDLLEKVANHVKTDDKPFKVVSLNNGALSALQTQGLVETRQKGNNALMFEVALSALGLQVFQNEVEHEIVVNHETVQETTVEEKKMEEVQQANVGNFVIEDDIEIPDLKQTRRSNRPTMPLDVMQVGQSFLVPFKEDEDIVKGRKRVASTVSQTRRRKLGADSKAVFATVAVENGYRVWRTA